jgi:Zn-dependent protease
MYVLKFGNCRVCVTPLVAMVEMIAIFYAVQAFAAVEGLAFSVVDCLIISALIFIGSLGSLFMHEYAHMLTAQRMGLPVQGIIISLFGAYTAVGSEMLSLKGAFMIPAAGPLINIVMGIIFYGGHLVFIESNIVGTVCFCLSVFNGIFGAYNLIPVMPLDGGILVRSAFWSASSNFSWANQMSFNIGAKFVVICILAGIITICMSLPGISIIFFLMGFSLGQGAKSAYHLSIVSQFSRALFPGNR